MDNQANQVNGYILELYRHGIEAPVYVSVFDPNAEAGFDGYSETREDAVIFESREALLPLASIEVEAVTLEGDEEKSAFDGFRILAYQGKPRTQLVSQLELEAALQAFDE